MENWKRIDEFPKYSVSDRGRVRNDESGRMMTQLQNQTRAIHVGLTKNLIQQRRSVALLVAEAFLPNFKGEKFDTPMHLNGDRRDNRVDNLVWRPRWFAIKYSQQFERKNKGIKTPIREINTMEEFPNAWEAALTHGLLVKDISLAIYNRTYIYPTYQEFELIE